MLLKASQLHAREVNIQWLYTWTRLRQNRLMYGSFTFLMMLSSRYREGSLVEEEACKQKEKAFLHRKLGDLHHTVRMCLSMVAQMLAAAALFSAASIVSMLMCVLDAHVKSVLKDSAYCRMSSL